MKNILTSLLVISSLVPISAQAEKAEKVEKYICQSAIDCVRTACEKYIENLKGAFVNYLSSECLAEICDGGTGTVVTVYNTGDTKDKKYWDEVFTPTKAEVCEDYYNKQKERKEREKEEMDENGVVFTCMDSAKMLKEYAEKADVLTNSLEEQTLKGYKPLPCVVEACNKFAEENRNNIHTYADMFEKYKGDSKRFAKNYTNPATGSYYDDINNSYGQLDNTNALASLILDNCTGKTNHDLPDALNQAELLYQQCQDSENVDSSLIFIRTPKDNKKYEEETYKKFDNRIYDISCKDLFSDEDHWQKFKNRISYQQSEFFFFAFSSKNYEPGDDFNYVTDLDFLPQGEGKCFDSLNLATEETVINRKLQNSYGLNYEKSDDPVFFITHNFDWEHYENCEKTLIGTTVAEGVVCGASSGYLVSSSSGPGMVIGGAIGGAVGGGMGYLAAKTWISSVKSLERADYNNVEQLGDVYKNEKLMTDYFGVQFDADDEGGSHPADPSSFLGVFSVQLGSFFHAYEIISSKNLTDARKKLQFLKNQLDRTYCAKQNPYICAVAVVPRVVRTVQYDDYSNTQITKYVPSDGYDRKVVQCIQLQ